MPTIHHHTRRAIAIASAALLFAALSAAPRAAEPITDPVPGKIEPAGIQVELQVVAEGFGTPVDLIAPPGDRDRLFVVDQNGLLRVIEKGKLLDAPALDLRHRLVKLRKGFDERGFLGLAFHPNFNKPDAAGSGKLYTYTSEPLDPDGRPVDFRADMTFGEGDAKVTIPADHQSVIAEWSIDPDNPSRVLADSGRIVLTFEEPQWNHNGGDLLFDDHGRLYIATGDGGGGNDYGPGHGKLGNGQNINSHLGKILRIFPLTEVDGSSYSVPDDNPFVGKPGLDIIYAYGLRNPWRIGWLPDGRLVAGDVGQESIEELNVIVAGGNYGWNDFEGEYYFNPTAKRRENISREPNTIGAFGSQKPKLPIVQYDQDEGLSIVAGYVYTGSDIPALKGLYVFGDWAAPIFKNGKRQNGFGDGRLFVTNLDDEKPVIQEVEMSIAGKPLTDMINAFGQDHSGEMYVLTAEDPDPAGDGGKVYRIAPAK